MVSEAEGLLNLLHQGGVGGGERGGEPPSVRLLCLCGRVWLGTVLAVVGSLHSVPLHFILLHIYCITSHHIASHHFTFDSVTLH